VQVRYSEDIASHTGLKPCGVSREGCGEASAEGCAGQPLLRLWTAATANQPDERCERCDQPGNRIYHECYFDNRHRNSSLCPPSLA